MKRAPKSWGSPESLELQALLLLELRTFLLRRRTYTSDPFEVRDAYARFVAHRLPDSPGRFMADVLPAEQIVQELPALVAALRDDIVSTLGPEDSFKTAAVAIEVRFHPEMVIPPFGKAARYVGRLLSTMGAIVRGTGGRSTDAAFTVPDVRFSSREGAGPSVLFAFDLPGGESAAIRAQVEALQTALVVAECALVDEDFGLARVCAALPEPHARAMIAQKVRRLQFARGIHSVQIGGVALQRSPILLDETFGPRIDALIERIGTPHDAVPEAWSSGAPTLLPDAPPRFPQEARR
jgi:hypothetical protein